MQEKFIKKNEGPIKKELLGNSGLEDIENQNIDKVREEAQEEIKQETKRVLDDNKDLKSKFSGNPEIDSIITQTESEIRNKEQSIDSEISSETNEVLDNKDEEHLSEEIINQIRNEENLIESYKIDMDRNNEFIEKNNAAVEELKDHLDLLVTKSSFYSENGGYDWQLVKPTEQYQKLNNELVEYKKTLESQGKSFNVIMEDPKVNEFIQKLEEIGSSNSELGRLIRRNSGSEIVLKSVSHAIDIDSPMSLGQALNKSNEYYGNDNEKIKNKILSIKENIENLKKSNQDEKK